MATYCMPCYQRRYDKWKSAKDAQPRLIQALLDDLSKRPIDAHELQTRHGTRYISLIRKLKACGYPIGRRRKNGTVVWYLVQKSKWCQNCSGLFMYLPMTGNEEPAVCQYCADILRKEEDSRTKIATDMLARADGTGNQASSEEPAYRACLFCGQSSRLGSFCSLKCAHAYLEREISEGHLSNEYSPLLDVTEEPAAELSDSEAANPPTQEGSEEESVVQPDYPLLRDLFPGAAIVHLAAKAEKHNLLSRSEWRALHDIGRKVFWREKVSDKQAQLLELLLRKSVDLGIVDIECDKPHCHLCPLMKGALIEHGITAKRDSHGGK